MNTTIKTAIQPFGNVRTWLTALVFIAGNILLPQLCHLLQQGGPTWLPIYFFTLVGAYTFGWRAGLITALASPLLNSMLFGMPAAAMLAPIMLKSVILAILAGYAASEGRRPSPLTLGAIVLGYQGLGTLGEWMLCGDLMAACQDFRIGIPGMLLQIAGGWIVINLIRKTK